MQENQEITTTDNQSGIENRPIETITQEIQYYKTQVGSGIIEIGRRLIEAKRVLPQGEWLPYLKETIEFSERTAQNFMRIAREYADPQTVADLGAAKAVCLLALTPEEREEAIENTHEVDGEEKTVYEMSKREVDRLTKEIAEERKKAETIQFEYDEKLKESAEKHNVELDAANEQLNTLKKELEDLKNQEPPTVIAELDEESIEEIEKIAKNEAKKDFDKKEKALKKEIEKAEKAVAEAKTAEENAKKEAEKAEARALELAAAVEKAEKEIRIAGSPEITEFKVHFDACRNQLEQMKEVIYFLQENGKNEDAKKLTNALCSLCSQAAEAVGGEKNE